MPILKRSTASPPCLPTFLLLWGIRAGYGGVFSGAMLYKEVIAWRGSVYLFRSPERISARTASRRDAVDEEEVPCFWTGLIGPPEMWAEKIERSAEASRDNHSPYPSPSRGPV